MKKAKKSTWKRSELHGKRNGKQESVMEVKAQMLLVHEALLLTVFRDISEILYAGRKFASQSIQLIRNVLEGCNKNVHNNAALEIRLL